MNASSMPEPGFKLGHRDVVEASIDQLLDALKRQRLTAVELVGLYLTRIAYYDRHGLHLNAIPVLNPHVFAEALASDRRRAAGHAGVLEGIPFTVKDSYSVKGLTVASGSPAFAHLIAGYDAWSVKQLRAAGAILIGKTTMPPMAYGGMERGLYGRAESPYNKHYLTAAYASGSSNGSATATAASFAAFGLGEETVSSGRSPASNNGLVAYTPSRGLISIHGNWPLYPTCDVVVPHTRSMDDMLHVLDVLVQESNASEGDFWRRQTSVSLPAIKHVRPKSYISLKNHDFLAGKRIGVPKMYIGTDTAIREPIALRPSIKALWQRTRQLLEDLGAEVIETDFPVVSNYDKDRNGTQSMYDRGLVPESWRATESCELIGYGWETFLEVNADAKLNSLAQVDPDQIFPTYPGTIGKPDRVHGRKRVSYHDIVKAAAIYKSLDDFSHMPAALKGLEQTRKVDFEDWLDAHQLDFVVFPANADIGKADSDTNPAAHADAWKNGTQYSNGNRAIRHLGIPTISVCMGIMDDTNMPVNLTFAGKAYQDNDILKAAYAYEQASHYRQAPTSTPAATHLQPQYQQVSTNQTDDDISLELQIHAELTNTTTLDISGHLQGASPLELWLSVNGNPIEAKLEGMQFMARAHIHSDTSLPNKVENPYQDKTLVVAIVRDKNGHSRGQYLSIK